MAVTTKKGDKGETFILFGDSVSKDHLRVESCGTLDELNSHLGLVRCSLEKQSETELVISIQRDLFKISSEVATEVKNLEKLNNRIETKDVKRLESIIDKLEKEDNYAGEGFYLPGETTTSAKIDIARTVARRAERRLITMKNQEMLQNKSLLIYLNRLSDLFYLLARKHGQGKHLPL